MRHTGRTTRLFHAIVVMGLGAAGCGGSVETKAPSDSGQEAAQEAESTSGDDGSSLYPPLTLPEAASPVANDAGSDGAAARDAAVDHWYPPPPVIA
jgi:hypothetical protein